MVIRHSLLLTVVGPLLAAASETGLIRLEFLREAYEYKSELRRLLDDLAEEVHLREDPGSFEDLTHQLGEYFCGRRREFDLTLDPQGTGFQLRVWKQIRKIPFGKLRSYKDIAHRINRPQATRAVGQAVRSNPIVLVIPCHRVIGQGGRLVGFGGGLHLKSQLLRLEGHTLGKVPRIVAPRLF